MKSCVLHRLGDLRCEEVPIPHPKSGEVRIRVRACGVCGSDIPRVFVKGTYVFPLTPGHEIAGEIEAAGPGVDEALLGKTVAVFPLIPCRRCDFCLVGEYAQCGEYNYLGSRCDGGFAEYVCAPVWNLVLVPEVVSLEEAAMTEPAAVAAHALRQAKVDLGDTVMIFGAGPIGLILAQIAQTWGAGRVLLVDIDPHKLDFAVRLGFDSVCDANTEDPVAWARRLTKHGADLVVEGSGAGTAFEQAMHAARPFGRVVLMGNPLGDMRLSQQGYWAILRKQLRVLGAWNSSYASMPRNEWDLALSLMAQGKLNLRPLITHRVKLEDLPGILVMMRDRAEFSNKVMCVADS